MELSALEAENKLLREFYDSWVFFHKLRAEPSDMGEAWDRKRLEMAAQALTNAATKVGKHVKRLHMN